MSITKQVKAHINQLPMAKAFTASSLYHLGSADTIRKILGRLTKSGKIVRLSRGVFAKPKPTRFGQALPSTYETIEAIAKSTGEVLAIHGAEAARRLHLSTQMPLQLVLYTSGKSRKIKVRNRTVTLLHISPRKMIASNTNHGLAISALWYLGREHVTNETIETIAQSLGEKEFNKVLSHTEHMPAWMANSFYNYQQGSQIKT